MDINNIALVRATNIIPFDGIMKPISNVPYLCKNISGEFPAVISDLLHELGIIEPMDPAKMFDEDYYDNMVATSSKILKEYLPYISDYNSCILFSLNGICPDDSEHGFGNNTFSNKVCGIIEPLVHHIDNVISLIPTDTAIQGDVYLSPEAIILIAKSKYLELSSQEKERLNNLNLKVKIFEGSLKEAITTELKNSGRYIPETLTLSRKYGGFMPSNTSEEQLQLINKIAQDYGKAQVLYFNILTGKNDELEKLESVKDELDNAWKVQDYYILNFLNKLLIYMAVPDNIINQLPMNLHSRAYMEKIKKLIKDYGIENYKTFVDSYNSYLKQLQLDMTLPTPNEIIQGEDKDLKGARL